MKAHMTVLEVSILFISCQLKTYIHLVYNRVVVTS